MNGWSGEERFIYEFLKVLYGNGSEKLLNLYLKKSSFEKITEVLKQHEMVSFFHHVLACGKVPLRLPAATAKEWQYLAGQTALHNMHYEVEGGKINKSLSELGIHCVLLKGMAFMESLYGNTWVRAISDLDLLIDRSDYPPLKEYLFKNGFSHHSSELFRGTPEEYLAISESFHNEVGFVKYFNELPLYLDVHWDVGGLRDGSPMKTLFPINQYNWLSHTEPFCFGAAAARRLNLNMQFIHLVYHFALNHQFRGLKWFVDLCQFAAVFGNELDWAFIHKTLDDHNNKRVFGITIRLISEVVGNSGGVAEKWQEFWSGEGLPGEYRFYRRHLFSRRTHTGTYLCLLFLPEKAADKWKTLAYLLFNQNAVTHWRSPDSKGVKPALQPFYIIYRIAEEMLLRVLGKKPKTDGSTERRG
jgi:hypothetical protein